MKNISFFSYKGGSGRTSILYNTIPFLVKELGATETEPIILMDLDIDSKGLSYLLAEKSKINTIQILKGCDYVNTINRNMSIQEHPFFKNLSPVGCLFGLEPKDNKSVLFVSAHHNNDDDRFINGNSNFDDSNISLSLLNRLCEFYKCKAIVMDTPAGNQLACDVSLSISQTIVTVMRITKQFREGTYEFLKTKSQRFNNKSFIIVPNAVPNAQNTIYSIEKIMESIKRSCLDCVNTNNYLNLKMIDSNGINEVQQFKFEEKVLFEEKNLRKLSQDEENAIAKYEFLATEIVNNANL